MSKITNSEIYRRKNGNFNRWSNSKIQAYADEQVKKALNEVEKSLDDELSGNSQREETQEVINELRNREEKRKV